MSNIPSVRSHIDLGNVLSGVLDGHLVTSAEGFRHFKAASKGIPILIPACSDHFTFDEGDVFEVPHEDISSIVFDTPGGDYVGHKTSFPQTRFLKNVHLKPEIVEAVDNVVSQNQQVKDHVSYLRGKHGSVGSFQTRNIPHFGHERIIKMMLDACEHVVINPVVGSRKSGDVKIENLSDLFDKIISKKFEKRISFMPIWANMYYAGPREAVHHALMRKRLGFTHFSVGRDHAGAEGVYPPGAAIELVRRCSSSLGIDVLTHGGALYCSDCGAVVLKDECHHEGKSLQDISGSSFRSHIVDKTTYWLADTSIQKHLAKMDTGIFEE